MPHKRNPEGRRADLRARARRARRVARRLRERRALARARHLALLGRARRHPRRVPRRSTTCSTASPGSSRGSSSTPSACCATSIPRTGSSSPTGFCWRWSSPDSAREQAYRLVQRPGDAGLGRGARLPRARRRPTRRSAARLGGEALDSVFDLAATVAQLDTVFERLHDSSPRRNPSMPDSATHLASGKVREIYALDDERAAPGRERPHLDLRRRPADRDPRQGPRAHGSFGLLVRTDHGDRAQPPALTRRTTGARATAGRLEMLPIECVVRGYLAGSGWKDYRTDGEVCGHRLPDGLVESQQLPQPIFTPATKATTGHDENIDRAAAAALVGESALRRGRAADARALPLRLGARARPRDHPRRHQARVRARRRRRARARRRGVHPRLVALLAGRRYVPAGRSPRSTSSSCATTASRSAGTRPPPGPALPDDVVAGTRARYVEAFEQLTGIGFDEYLADPAVVLR